MESEKRKRSLSLTQHFLSGSIAGMVETFINHPLWVMKMRMQCGAPFTFDVRLLYRGVLPNVVSTIPVSALQMGFTPFYQSMVYKNAHELSLSQRMMFAFAAGGISSFINGPAELVMTHQQQRRESFYKTVKYIISRGGFSALSSGLLASILRDGKYSVFLLVVTPLIKDKIRFFLPNDLSSSTAASMISGLGAAVVSHGADTIKQIQQAADPALPINMKDAIFHLYQSKGARGFFSGFSPRALNVMSAITIMTLVSNKIEACFSEKNLEESKEKPKPFF
jgi:hypothetical protein